MRPSRRQMLAALGAGALLPRLAHAVDANDRVFLFLYVEGGWDPAFVFTPLFGTGAYEEPGASTTTAGGYTIVDHPDREAVKFFFEENGRDICLIHGLEVPSITHERCEQLLLTGTTGAGADWPTTIAAQGLYSMPHLVLDGPVYSGAHPQRVVRVGDSNQLARLLDQDLGPYATQSPLDADVQSLVDAHVLGRAEGLGGEHADSYASTLRGLDRLFEDVAGVSFGEQGAGCTRDFALDFEVCFDAFEGGMSRCAMLRHRGWCNQGWDTHQNLDQQVGNYEDLFYVLWLMQEALRSRPDLKERLVVVVASEMGRHPQLNSWGGKDHWTWTSLMLMGSGVRGGAAVGGLDAYGRGLSVDLSTGGEGSVPLGPRHLGATLLTLAGLDASDVGEPIAAALE